MIPGDQFAVIPGRGKAANPESSDELRTLGWIPDSRFAASGMTAELIGRISDESLAAAAVTPRWGP
ncbi:hypothetical protein [Rhodoplanes serenus]|uniref:hypothetical protein n=1 Tax=Rhodoplanes serenus TaxID=200615 RepID=UPI0011B935C3|nr:hypothetical protein [Rhodoplanes serenus]